MSSKQRKEKKGRRIKIVLLILFLAVAAAAAVFLIIKFMPSFEKEDLAAYYGLEDSDESEMAIILRDLPLSGDAEDEDRDRIGTVILEEKAILSDGTIYIPAEIASSYIDERFYYDSTDGILVVTTAEEMYTAAEGETSYASSSGESTETGAAILKVIDGTAYISMDFVDTFSDAYYSSFEDPARVVIDYISEDNLYCEVSRSAKIREYAGTKSDIIGEVSKGDILQVKRTLEDWYEVISSEGYVGYIKASCVSEPYSYEEESDYDEPEYTSLSLGETVKLGWLAVYNSTANANYYNNTEGIDEMNVICPTWYTLSSADGDVEILSNTSIVNSSHLNGYIVWAMISDGDYEYVEALSSTSKRQKIIDTIMEDVLSKGIDGINVDFERITDETGEDYIEFLRELSIRCRKEGIYLSADNYAPYDSRSCYHIEEQSRLCDYVIVMAYDDYVGTDTQGPNSSLEFLQEVTELSLEKVDSEKLIIALPFYCRFWIQSSDGTLSSETYKMSAAWSEIEEYGAEAVWDSELGLYTAVYTDSEGNTVYAYLENSETIQAKLSLLENYSLSGVGFWRLNQEYDDVWDVIAEY